MRKLTDRVRPASIAYNQEKIAAVNMNFGANKPYKNQGTLRVIFDEILMRTSTSNQDVYNFFDNSRVRSFPHTNLPLNKFEKNESMGIERISLQAVVYSQSTGEILSIYDLTEFIQLNKVFGGLLDVYFDNNRVVKELSLIEMMPQFNPHSKWGSMAVIIDNVDPATGDYDSTISKSAHTPLVFPTPLIIPELMQFYMNVRVPSMPTLPFTGVDTYLRLTAGGFSYINAPKQTH